MRFENCTLGYIKALYLEKAKAVQDNDQKKLKYLNETYPELFNAKFMMDILKNEFKRQQEGLDDNMVMKFELFQYQ